MTFSMEKMKPGPSLRYCTQKNCRFRGYGINTQMSLEKVYWILQAMDSMFVSKRALKELPNAFMSLSELMEPANVGLHKATWGEECSIAYFMLQIWRRWASFARLTGFIKSAMEQV